METVKLIAFILLELSKVAFFGLICLWAKKVLEEIAEEMPAEEEE